MQIIDVNEWERKALYECFSKYDNPIFSMSVRMDVTELVKTCKKNRTSFFANFLYIVTEKLNEIEDFRIRIKDGQVVMYDRIDPSFIVMAENGVIVTCRSEANRDYAKFYKDVRANIERAKKETDRPRFNNSRDNDLFYISCLPWTDFLSMSNPYNLLDPDTSSIPRLTWGKYTESNGKYELTFDIAAHHALMDGFQMSQGFQSIQEALNDAENILK